jgi:hypothetical protein
MFGWLKNAFNWGIGGLKDLWNKAVQLIMVVYSYVDGWVNALLSDINSLYQWASGFINAVQRWVFQLYTSLSNWVTKIYGDFERWVSGLYGELKGDILGIIRWITQQLNNVVNWALAQLNRLEKWVLDNIWNPLYNAVRGAVDWITKYGYWAYYMVTHPDQLALIVGKYILGAWIGLGRRYAGVFGRWMVHTMIRAGHDVAGILEDVIASII